MIPCSKLTDRWGRKRCFTAGLVLYGIGALLSAVSPGLGVLILGNSVFEGVGTALLIPPVYILTTLRFTRSHVARPRVRRHQRDGRHRRRGRPADRRAHHDRRSAGAPRSCSRPLVVALIVLLSRRRRRTRSPPDPTRRSTRSARSCRRSACSSSCSASSRPTATRLLMAVLAGRRRGASWRGSSSTSAAASGRARSRCCRRALFKQPHLEPRAGHAEHPVAAAHGRRRSPCRSSCRPCAATTRSRPA